MDADDDLFMGFRDAAFIVLLAEALTACRTGRQLFPDDAELLFWEAVLLREDHQLEAAAARLLQLLDLAPSHHFTSADAGLRGYRARQLLGEIFRDLGRAPEAEAQWRAALAECPVFTPARLTLAELLFEQGRWAELEQAVQILSEDLQARIEAVVLHGRGLLARRQFAAALRGRLQDRFHKWP